MGKVNSITKLEIAIFVFLTMMISGASSIASNDFIRIIVVGLLALYSFINHKNLYNNILFYLLSGWILINLISSLYFGKNIDFSFYRENCFDLSCIFMFILLQG